MLVSFHILDLVVAVFCIYEVIFPQILYYYIALSSQPQGVGKLNKSSVFSVG